MSNLYRFVRSVSPQDLRRHLCQNGIPLPANLNWDVTTEDFSQGFLKAVDNLGEQERIQCVTGPLAGKSFVVTDPGRALISGTCADIGKLKGPILRGLAGRAPYFHNGSAATLLDVVTFYNQRFNIGLTPAQMSDMATFLQTL
jgi:cytochrome c peroxidase